MPRSLAAGQSCRILTIDVASGATTLVHASADTLYEAPNWSHDGSALIVNGDGHLWRLDLDGDPTPSRIDLGDLAPLNNDHVLDPDGVHVFVSADDGHVYRAPLAGGTPRRVTAEDGHRHYLHGVSPDGATLAYTGVVVVDGEWEPPDLFLVPAAGGPITRLTDDAFPDDGPEFSPDGAWLYFNSERARTAPGHAQLFRMRPDGTDIAQLTHDERVNWFPHPSPDGRTLAYVSFPPGTQGHPPDREVIVRLCDADGSAVRDLVHLVGGQGTMNVPSWSPDGTRLAYVDYPS